MPSATALNEITDDNQTSTALRHGDKRRSIDSYSIRDVQDKNHRATVAAAQAGIGLATLMNKAKNRDLSEKQKYRSTLNNKKN